MKNKNLAIAGICTLLLVLVLSATYAYYTINISNSFTDPVNVGASTEEVGTVIISSSSNDIELNLTRSNLLSEIGTSWYGVTSGAPTSTKSYVKLGELSTTSGAVLCDVTMSVTFTNKELVNALAGTGELELNIGETVVDLYNKKSDETFNVIVEDVYTDTYGNDLEGNIIYHITDSDQNSEAGKSAGLTINYSSMTCSPTEEGAIHYAFGNPKYSSPTTPPADHNVYVALYPRGEKAVCINRNGTQNCFKNNIWAVEKQHIPEVFSDSSCHANSDEVWCRASDFDCYVNRYGYVTCDDYGTGESCDVSGFGDVDCNVDSDGDTE